MIKANIEARLLVASLAFLMIIGTALKSNAQSWVAQNVNSFGWRFEDLFFIDDQEAWACDGGGQIVHTTNAGVNWSQQYYNSSYYFRAIEFFDSDLGFAGTLSSALLKTEDGGDTWTDITSSLPTVPAGICGISVADDTTIYVTGVFYGSAYFMKSIDRGDTWTYTSMGAQANGLVDVHFKNANEGWLVGQSAQGTGLKAIILHTTNGGANWDQIAIGTEVNERAWKIQFLNDSVGFVSVEEVVPDPIYFKTTDGGQSWVQHTIPSDLTEGSVQGIGFLNEQLGWVGGFNDLLYETTDGGQDWQYQPNIVQSFNRFWRIDQTTIYAGGLTVYKYTDQTLSTDEQFVPKPPKGHKFGLASANPAKDISSIQLELINDTYAELSLYDLKGNRIQTIEAEPKKKGKHLVLWKHTDVTAGTYLLMLYTNHGYEHIKVVLE